MLSIPSPAALSQTRTLLLGIVVLFLASRLFNLLALPMFNDEAIELLWSIDRDPIWPVAGGKWLTIQVWSLNKLLPLPPLMTARLTAVFSGLIATLATFAAGRALASSRVGLLGASILLLAPYAVFHNRLAVADNLQMMFGAITLLLSVQVTHRPRRVLAYMGLVLALFGAVLSKISGIVFIALPLLTLILCPLQKQRRAFFFRLLAVLIAEVLVMGLIALGFGAYEWQAKATLPTGSSILTNVATMVEWFAVYLTPGGALVALVAFVSGLRTYPGRYLAAVLVIMLAVYALIGRLIFSRYILFALVPLALLIALWLDRLIRANARRALALVTILCVLPMLAADVMIVFAVERAPLHPTDRVQYITGWPSGYGMQEIMAFLLDRADEGPIRVAYVDGLSYPRPALLLALRGMPHIELVPHQAESVETPASRDLPTYVVLNRPLNEQSLVRSRLVWSYMRPGGESSLVLHHCDN